jgi:Na+-transporting NADH:ubiquinone oxidoreductase subunit NqrC
MPKTKTRKQRKGVTSTPSSRVTTASQARVSSAQVTQEHRVRRVQSVRTMQSLILPGMVALGCWGLAFSFTFLTHDQNHLLFGGMAALMALMWTLSLGMRVRKMLQQK